MSYRVAEIFATLQGEGAQAGMPAVFLRFSGCNLWSGEGATRARDAARSGARCPLFCDTDFRRGEALERGPLVERVISAAAGAGMTGVPLVVITGGEPLLQLDSALLDALAALGARIAIETNGSIPARSGVLERLDWICVSPKGRDEAVEIRAGQELKVVVPAYDPRDYAALAKGFDHLFVQPEARVGEVGESVIEPAAVKAAIDLCLKLPGWRLSMQTHKLVGLP